MWTCARVSRATFWTRARDCDARTRNAYALRVWPGGPWWRGLMFEQGYKHAAQSWPCVASEYMQIAPVARRSERFGNAQSTIYIYHILLCMFLLLTTSTSTHHRTCSRNARGKNRQCSRARANRAYFGANAFMFFISYTCSWEQSMRQSRNGEGICNCICYVDREWDDTQMCGRKCVQFDNAVSDDNFSEMTVYF